MDLESFLISQDVGNTGTFAPEIFLNLLQSQGVRLTEQAKSALLSMQKIRYVEVLRKLSQDESTGLWRITRTKAPISQNEVNILDLQPINSAQKLMSEGLDIRCLYTLRSAYKSALQQNKLNVEDFTILAHALKTGIPHKILSDIISAILRNQRVSKHKLEDLITACEHVPISAKSYGLLHQPTVDAMIRQNFRSEVPQNKVLQNSLTTLQERINSRFSSFREAFMYFDLDHDGKIFPTEFYHALAFLKLPLPSNASQEIFNHLDVHSNGFLTFEDFVDLKGETRSLSPNVVLRERRSKSITRRPPIREPGFAYGKPNQYDKITDIISHRHEQEYLVKIDRMKQRIEDHIKVRVIQNAPMQRTQTLASTMRTNFIKKRLNKEEVDQDHWKMLRFKQVPSKLKVLKLNRRSADVGRRMQGRLMEEFQ